jgi:hypothetical protein
MSSIKGMLAVIPSRLQVGEKFTIKIKVLGAIIKIPCSGNWNDKKPSLKSPFNLNVARQIQFHDNCLPEWQGVINAEGETAFQGKKELVFNGENQGAFYGDKRPIKEFGPFSFSKPGFHFIKLTDKASKTTSWTNPVYVTEEAPKNRIYWGDPHWQTFFSDGIRCPEELYAFARDEAFLDFGAISDHMEAVTDRQWDYFQAVTNDFNAPGRFATLLGQEWTHHNKEFGAPGHRNIYYRGDNGPAIRSNDPDCNTLDKLWRKLDSFDGLEAIAIPHHSANETMGVDWNQGWNSKYEKAVEIYSVWGSSEKAKEEGNTHPIQTLGGEKKGQHVIDALQKGFKFGFVGGGDIHDGRPGDDLHPASYPPRNDGTESHPQGFTACFAPELTRENIFDAIKNRKTYATSKKRIYLDVDFDGQKTLKIKTASEDGIDSATIVFNGNDLEVIKPDSDSRIIDSVHSLPAMIPGDFFYVRTLTSKGDIAWSSPEMRK